MLRRLLLPLPRVGSGCIRAPLTLAGSCPALLPPPAPSHPSAWALLPAKIRQVQSQPSSPHPEDGDKQKSSTGGTKITATPAPHEAVTASLPGGAGGRWPSGSRVPPRLCRGASGACPWPAAPFPVLASGSSAPPLPPVPHKMAEERGTAAGAQGERLQLQPRSLWEGRQGWQQQSCEDAPGTGTQQHPKSLVPIKVTSLLVLVASRGAWGTRGAWGAQGARGTRGSVQGS